MYKLKHKYPITIIYFLISFVFVVIFCSTAYSQDSASIQPFVGTVITDSGVVVRKTPPRIDVVYKLGEKICSLGRGAKFTTKEQLNIINGEIWYSIETLGDISNISDCGNQVSGWIVGRLGNSKNLRELVEIAPLNVNKVNQKVQPEIDNNGTSPIKNSESNQVSYDNNLTNLLQKEPSASINLTKFTDKKINTVKGSKPNSNTDQQEKEKTGTNTLTLWSYFRIIIGTLCGFVIIELERFDAFKGTNRQIKGKNVEFFIDVFSPTDILRVSALIIFNSILISRLIKYGLAEFTNAGENIIVAFVPQLISDPLGNLIAGFVLSIFVLRFISFSWSSGT